MEVRWGMRRSNRFPPSCHLPTYWPTYETPSQPAGNMLICLEPGQTVRQCDQQTFPRTWRSLIFHLRPCLLSDATKAAAVLNTIDCPRWLISSVELEDSWTPSRWTIPPLVEAGTSEPFNSLRAVTHCATSSSFLPFLDWRPPGLSAN